MAFLKNAPTKYGIAMQHIRIPERRESLAKLILCSCLLSLAIAAMAQQSRELRVSATIPPKSCRFPDRCDQVDANTLTRLTVKGDVIRYVGSQPKVTRNDGVMTILF